MIYGETWEVVRERSRVMGDDEWRPWFAWYRVRLDNGQKAWWELIEYHQPMRYDIPRYRIKRD